MKEKELRFIEIVDKFSALIRYVIQKNLYKKDNIDLEDIEQEVKIKIWKFIAKGKKVEKLPSYIKRVAYTVTVDELRKVRKQMPPRELDELKMIYSIFNLLVMEKKINSPESILEKKELKLSIKEAIDSLVENRKQVLRLYMKGMSIEEICDFLKWDKVKVRHLLYRGIDDIKEKLKL
ncbi:MAG: RNA polymerase sigma factor [Candidatus Aminicenantia bacterium]